METKLKLCKSIGKANGFKSCGMPTFKRTFGMCPSCFYDFLKTDERGKIIYAKSFLPQVSKKTEQRKKESDKAAKEKLKTLSQYESEAKKSFQRFIRLRDAKLGCISCDNPKTDLYDGGHFKKAEIYSGLIFDERNCFKQCRKCNRFLSGNEGEYRINLVSLYGNDWVVNLENDANLTRSRKYTKDELIEIKTTYNAKIREIESGKQAL